MACWLPATAHIAGIENLATHGEGCINLLLRDAMACITLNRTEAGGACRGAGWSLTRPALGRAAAGTAAHCCRQRDASVAANSAVPAARCTSQPRPSAHPSGRRTLQGGEQEGGIVSASWCAKRRRWQAAVSLQPSSPAAAHQCRGRRQSAGVLSQSAVAPHSRAG